MGPVVAVSAPGKVFLAGGYLVLDRAYTALVFGLSARIHVVAQDVVGISDSKRPEIVVRSPQFKDAEWRYGYDQTNASAAVEVTQVPG
jgi:phosphomevalonate kinase